MHHLWCASAINRVFAETGTSYETATAAAAAKTDLQSRQQQKPGFCSALYACFGASKSQSRQDDVFAPPARTAGTEADGADRGRKLKGAASSAVGSQAEAIASPEDGSNRGAALSIRQQCLQTSRSKHSSKNPFGRNDHLDCQLEQTKDAVGQGFFQPNTVNLAAIAESTNAASVLRHNPALPQTLLVALSAAPDVRA